MTAYTTPRREMDFVLFELLDFTSLTSLPEFAEATPEFCSAVLDEAGKFAENVFAPLNRVGDEQGVRVEDDHVITADGFAEAYQLFAESEWLSLSQDPNYGGQGLPFPIHLAASEMWHSTCTSLALCPLLTAGGIDALSAHASDELKARYLPNMVSGKWTATMNLTEPHAGSDLSTLKTRAEPEGDHYRIRGQKIYITWGDHDLSENIVHIVLAPIAGAPPGNKGLSLFLVPKFLVHDDGTLGERNDVRVVSTEHKLGIHASPTCVMSFGENDGAIGYLVGEPGDGLACMFTLMNHARLEVGLQSVALAEIAYQGALSYARDRVQGRDVETGEPATIIQHADVQRMLMQMRALTEAMRAVTYDASFAYVLRHHGASEESRGLADERFALMTPIVKAWCSELVNEVASLGIQVHGGMGFIEETGAAQHYRDARITGIYEGTNGIQAQDLVARKILRDQGAALGACLSDIRQTIDELIATGDDTLRSMASGLAQSVDDLDRAARFVIEQAHSNPRFVGAVSYNFLMMMGYIAGAWYLARSAIKAIDKADADDFFAKKLVTARFYFGQLLPRYKSCRDAVIEGAGPGVELSVANF